MAGKKDRKVEERHRERTRARRVACGLCGKTENLTRTECCGQWICDDEHEYVLFSHAHNSCYRNHRRYTLCSHHATEGHEGRWQDCPVCRESFPTEMYVWYGTNEYNFAKLPNPPSHAPTTCSKCGRVINLATDEYSIQGGKHFCSRCQTLRPRDLPPDSQMDDDDEEGEYDSDALLATLNASQRKGYDAVVAATDAFCQQHLNEEYRDLCREMALELALEEIPLSRGRPEGWAAAIVYELGVVNLLADASQTPHMNPAEIAQGFGVSMSTIHNRARTVRAITHTAPFDPNWTLPSREGDNPLTWMMEVNGMIIDLRDMPRDLQERAFDQGLIPYIPADGPPHDDDPC